MVAIIVPKFGGTYQLRGLIAGGAAAKSIVLSDTDNSYLSRTWGASATLNTKATIAFFVKFVGAAPAADRALWDSGATGGPSPAIQTGTTSYANKIAIQDDYGAWITKSNSSITDTSWHHLTVAFDSTQATAANRLKIYIDGTEVAYDDHTVVAQNASWHLTDNGVACLIGALFYALTNCVDVKLAYYYLIDGQALAPSDFTTGTGAGTTSPKTYSGTYGTNGFFLNFNNDANDQSGNGNNWTQNNIPTFDADLPT